MTTPRQQPETGASADFSEAPQHARLSDDATEHAGSSDDATETSRSSTTESAEPRTGTATDGSLFGGHDFSSLRSRWADVQAGFVDDPKECVQKADALVADLVDKLTSGFAEARSRLEEQWARGEEVSTENLRVTLKRYRDFFEKLLAV